MTVEGTARPAARLWSRQTAPIIVGAVALMTCVAFEALAVVTVLPVVVDDLGDRDAYSLAFAATITTALVGMVVGGNWADRAGFRVPLAVGGATFVTGILVTAVAPDTFTFVAGRLLQGIGGGIDSVVVYVVVAKTIPEAVRPKILGLLVAAWLVPSLVGPVVAGALTEQLGWRVPFVAVAVGAAAALTTLLTVTRGREHHQPDPTVAVLGRSGRTAVVAAAALLVLHLASHRDGPGTAALIVPGLLVLLLAGSRLVPAGTLRGRAGIPRLVALRGLLGATVAAADAYLPLYLQAERGLRPTAAGLVVSVGAVGWLAGTWLQGRHGTTPRDTQRLLLAASLLVVCGPAATLLYTLDRVPLVVVVAGCILMGAGMGIAYPRLTSTVLALSSPSQYGSNSSSLQASESMTSAAFLAVTGAVLTGVAHPDGYWATYLLVAVLAGLAVGTAARNGAPAAK